MEEIIVNGKRYIPAEEGSLKICILQRGWVFVGNLTKNESQCKLTNASVVRVWGTSKGLGEIAENGPTSQTVLDPAGTVEFDYLTVVATISCNAEAWKCEKQ